MDGLSAAASGIAVVSLAIQLVDSIRGIQRFLRSIADAPEELSRLIELLEQLELILEGVGKLVENQRTQQGRLDIDVSPSILKAVQTCQKTLTKLEGLIAKVKQASEAQNRAARSFGRFRLACKKEDVEEFEVQLHRAVSNLNLAMTMNLSAFHSDGHRLLIGGISAMTQEFAILRTEVVTNCSIPRNEQSPSNRNQRSKYPSSRYPTSSKVLYRGVLGTITAIVYSRSEKSDNKDPYHHSDARDQTTYLIIPSFLSQCIQLQCKSSFRFVERTVRTFPVLPDDHAVWNLCREGAVTDIQRLFSNREISPYSVSSWGRSLLHEAAYHYATESHIWLIF
ncbi:hypothetical protein BDZ45DRAFT_72684 [Acephala macrosclerotiorum]|nr:hypothetical protein BDZ45DRAFT_72684 [Acephala macrosclerotiorum]